MERQEGVALDRRRSAQEEAEEELSPLYSTLLYSQLMTTMVVSGETGRGGGLCEPPRLLRPTTSQTSPSGTVQGPVAPATRAVEGYRSTSDYYRSQGRNRRRVAAMQRPLRVHWSHTVPDWNVSFSEVEVEQGVSTVVECCKPEWIDKGWKCYTLSLIHI